MKGFSTAQQFVLLGISLTIVLASVCRRLDGPLAALSHRKTRPHRQWAVEVTGAVRSPGVYAFNHSPTAGQAVQKAGGMVGKSFFSRVTPCNPLQSGVRVEAMPLSQMAVKVHLSRMDVTKRLVLGVPIDVNQAGPDELAVIPGISRSLAQRIVGFRESRNGFKTWHDLIGVKGVGRRNVKGFQRYLSLSPRTASEQTKPGP